MIKNALQTLEADSSIQIRDKSSYTRLPMLSPLDFYLWNYLKQLIHTADIFDEGI